LYTTHFEGVHLKSILPPLSNDKEICVGEDGGSFALYRFYLNTDCRMLTIFEKTECIKAQADSSP